MDNIEFVRKEVLAWQNYRTIKIQSLIGNSQRMMQGLNYHVFTRH